MIRRAGVPRKQRGVALITVLLIVTLATAIAYSMMTEHSVTVAQARLVMNQSNAREYVLGAEAYARQILFEDWENEETREIDTLLEDWAQPLTPFDVDNGTLEVQIIDLDRFFNLNAVSGSDGPENAARLKRLLTNLSLDPNLADVWVDWIDEDDEVNGFGAEDGEYLLADTPFRAANTLAGHYSEFALMNGLEPGYSATLAPFVTTLPTTELKLNVNTVSLPILVQSIAANFPLAEAETLLELEREFADVPSFTAEYAALGDSVPVLAVTSQFFRVDSRAEVGGARAELRSVLHREPTTGLITVISRDFGQRFKSVFVSADEQAEQTILPGDEPLQGDDG